MSERPIDGGLFQRSRTADALDLWRASERNVTRWTLSAHWRDDYRAAVAAALAYLQRYTTMAELVYVMRNQGTPVWLPERWGGGGERGSIVGPADRPLAARDSAAYWRRAQQLIAAAAGGAGCRTD